MSAAQSPTPVSKLEALQCHFTWDLDISTSLLNHRKDKLEDIGTNDGNPWLGHIYNLQGFIQYKLGSNKEAQKFFNEATEAFSQIRSADEGPWLVVNYGNLAWLHHHLGDQAESEAYLSKIDTLIKKYPSPSQEELHPETYAEKAYVLMMVSGDKTLVVDHFQRAIEMQPGIREWNTSHALALMYASKHSSTGLEDDILEKMRIAQEQDPENLAAQYLDQRGQRGERIEAEARELATKVLRSPVSSYSGLKPLLRVYTKYISVDEAIVLAEKALKNHPDERYLIRCAARCYDWKIFGDKYSRPKQDIIARAISVHQEEIALYPDSSLRKKIDLAKIYALSHDGQAKADQIYQELLESDLELADKQMLYNKYAKYLYFEKHNSNMSIRYHMKAAEIPHQSFFRKNSIKELEKIRDKGRDRMCREIRECLANLKVF
ncbi:interferon-induced protein with tetratricopeptide repeats 1-like [Pseudochaenichthys georgianus]|uniref:interferon-induced protein with tetratricopeptide repeats 1-like n=1 Tax=Pseudochaenichthys georgianus TaxID=52239 RepID=UPI00146B0BAB|nr:interferon-induced protein with tetratricopeptide repeats 1-like [Pseudochaenichthys georgianus]